MFTHELISKLFHFHFHILHTLKCRWRPVLATRISNPRRLGIITFKACVCLLPSPLQENHELQSRHRRPGATERTPECKSRWDQPARFDELPQAARAHIVTSRAAKCIVGNRSIRGFTERVVANGTL